jgi:hypothetical protein
MTDIPDKTAREANNEILKRWAEERGDRYTEDDDGFGRLNIPAQPKDKD